MSTGHMQAQLFDPREGPIAHGAGVSPHVQMHSFHVNPRIAGADEFLIAHFAGKLSLLQMDGVVVVSRLLFSTKHFPARSQGTLAKN